MEEKRTAERAGTTEREKSGSQAFENLQPNTAGRVFARWKKNDFVKNSGRYSLLLPSLVFMVVFAYLPMIGIVMAFQDYDPIAGFFGSKFNGFANFGYCVKIKTEALAFC